MSSETINEEVVKEEAAVLDIEEIIAMTDRLPALEKIKLIERLLSQIKPELLGTQATPRRSFIGIAADLGTAPTAEEIDQARQEMYNALSKNE